MVVEWRRIHSLQLVLIGTADTPVDVRYSESGLKPKCKKDAVRNELLSGLPTHGKLALPEMQWVWSVSSDNQSS